MCPDASVGYKGVVGVDRLLKGIKMRLRRSTNKFSGAFTDRAPIEIARAFERPNYCFLNRCDPGIDYNETVLADHPRLGLWSWF